MLNNYAESSGGFSNNHGQTSRTTTESQKQQTIGSTWGYNSQLEGMYYGAEPQAMFMGPYDGSTKHSNYPQYPSGTIHQPMPTPVVKCHEACCQHYQDHRYPLNPAPLRYQPTGPIQPRYADLSGSDSRQYFTDRRSMQPSISRKKVYPAENGYQNISDRHFPQYMGRGQMHMADSRQQMQMIRPQYPMYPPYWGGARGWTGPRMNCPPPPPYHQSVTQGAQLQAGLKITDASHYIDPTSQKPTSSQHRRGVGSSGGGTEIIRPVPEPKRPTLNPNLQSCHEFGYATSFVPFSEVNKGGGMTSQSNPSTCKIPNDKQYHPHQMQYPLQSNDRNMMNCANPINDLSYSMNFPMVGSDSYLRPGIDDNPQISDPRKLPLQYDSSIGKKRPDLDLRQYLSTWEDDEDENTRLTDSLALGNSAAPYIVVDCRSLEGEAASKLQDRFKTGPPTSKSRSSSPNTSKRGDELQNESAERGGIHSEFQTQTPYASAIPGLLNEPDKNSNFWNGTSREGDGVIGKGGAFQPLDCSKRDISIDPKRNSHPHNELPSQKMPSNESANMSFDALVSFYGDNRRTTDGGYDFVEMTERLVNNSEKSSTNNRSSLDQHPEISRPCDPRLQQSQLGNNPSIYNKVAPRYPTNNYQHYKPNITVDSYYNYKHPMAASKYFGFDNSQMVDSNYDYHKIISEFDSARLFGSKDPQKDPRRMFHPELDKSLESPFIDPMRKSQIADCFQEKSNLEFGPVDADQFMAPIIIKKSDIDNRIDKNSAIRERMDAINNEIHPEKTVLITSQNAPPEIFRVPYSPEKELSNKDNVVTLHSGDQTKSNTMTVEVPYVQQYSTLVKLSEQIGQSDKNDDENVSNNSDTNLTSQASTDEIKNPTSFKLKRLPNSKEWTVADKNNTDGSRKTSAESTTPTLQNDLPLPVSNLNMPSLDDIRDGDDICDTTSVTQKDKISSESVDSIGDNKNLLQTSKLNNNQQVPQMAVVQPMKLNQSKSGELDSTNSGNSLCEDSNTDTYSILNSSSTNNKSNINYEPDKVSTDSNSQMELNSEIESSKHKNFRSHKKIQNISNCLSSPNEEFLNPGDEKETYSPFHDYSDCDMNSHISDYFKIDERTPSDKILDTRLPSSPGVESMFEDINHSNPNQLYQSKSCNFQDLTDPNMVSIGNNNTDFQSFSNIFSEESDKGGRSDGSILQMNDKKYLKQIFDDIDNQQVLKSLENQEIDIESQPEKNRLHSLCSETKTSPPIPPISLKLNESKKVWCIAKKDQEKKNASKTDSVLKLTGSPQDTIYLEKDNSEINSVNLQDKNIICSSDSSDNSLNNYTKEKEHNYCFDKQNKSILNQLIFNNGKETNETHNLILKPSDIHKKTSASENNNLQSSISLRYLDMNSSQTKIDNQCRAVEKYQPKIKLLYNLRALNINPISEALVFDEKGIHFPNPHDGQSKDSKLIVGNIIESLITQCINISNMSVEKIEVGAPFLFKNNHADLHENCVESSSIGKAQSVITFDHLNQRDNCISKTTEVFIQREKENYQHYSVITSGSGCNLLKKTLTVRSIFSPMSEDNEEDISNVNCKTNLSQVNVQKGNNLNTLLDADKNHLCNLNKGNDIADEVVLDCSVYKTVISNCESNSVENITEESKTNWKDKEVYEDEAFRGFGSPNNESSLNKDGDICKRDNSEIDYALELMGLSSNKIEECPTSPLSSGNSDKCLDSLQESPKDFDNNDFIFSPTKNCPIYVQRNQNLFLEQNGGNKLSNSLKHPCTISTLNLSQEISEGTKLSERNESTTFENIQLQVDPKSLDSCLDPIINLNHEDNPVANDQPSEEISRINHLNSNKNVNLKIPNSKRCQKRKFSDENPFNELITPNFKICKEITNLPHAINDSQCTTKNDTGLCYPNKPIGKPFVEDSEARLETSVIVRNNSNGSVITSMNVSRSPSPPTCDTQISNTEPIYSSHHTYNKFQADEDSSKSVQVLTDNNNSSIVLQEANPSSHNNHKQAHIELLKLQDISNKVVEDEIKKTNVTSSYVSTRLQDATSIVSDIKAVPLNSTVVETDYSLSYCVSESVFLLFDDETTELLQSGKLSYLYGYKRNKWLKFKKTQNKLIVCNNDQFNQCDTLRRCSNKITVNEGFIHETEKRSITNKDIQHSSVNNLDIILNCAKQNRTWKYSSSEIENQLIIGNGVTINDHSQFDLKNGRCQSVLHYTNSIETRQSSKFDYKKNYLETEIGVDKSNEGIYRNSVEELPKMFKDVDTCTLNSSFKINETENILKEMFSPDPGVVESEHVNTLNTDELLNDMSSQNELSTENVPHSWNDHSLPSLEKEDPIKSNFTQMKDNISFSKCSSDSNKITNIPNEDVLVLSRETINSVNNDKPASKNDEFGTHLTENQSRSLISNNQQSTNKKLFFKTFDLNENPVRTLNHCKVTDPFNSDFGSTADESTSKDLRPSYESEGSIQILHRKNEITHLSNKTTNACNANSLLIEDSNICGALTKPENISNNSFTQNYHDNEPKDNDQVLIESHIKDISLGDLNNTSKQQEGSNLTNIKYDGIDDISLQNDSNNKKTPQNCLYSFTETKIMQGMDKENLISTQNLASVEEEFEDSSEIIEKDILLSKEILQKGFEEGKDFDSHLANNSIKTFLKRGRKIFSDSQKKKVNSVQDSLKINQHLNQETFPLQCLVEAALALENVDSKQMLINDSKFAEMYSQSKDSCETSFSESDKIKIDSNNKESLPIEKNQCEENKLISENGLTPADKEIFCKFEETNYNLRASTRIVTSSSSNIIPYSKRKYGLKAKLSSQLCENKQKKSESSTDKSRIKKRRGCFTYPRSKKRKRAAKDKQKCPVNSLKEDNIIESSKNCLNNTQEFETINNDKKLEMEEEVDNNEKLKPDILECSSDEHCLNNNQDYHLSKDSCQTDFGGPLLIANDKTIPEQNIFCVQVNADKVDGYVDNINLEDLEILSENNQTSFKDNTIIDSSSTDVSLENGTSLVIIIEGLEDHSDKRNFNDLIKEGSDIILGSIESSCSGSCLQQTNSILDDCSDILNSGFSVNEACSCPSEFEMTSNCETSLLKDQNYEILENDAFISKPSFEVSDGIEDDFRKYSVGCNEEMLIANGYDDINTNLVSDIGNWPYVEEEVAEFDIDPELPNKIPEEGRKIELKCSLPWKKIFNMSKTKKKKSKTSKKVSGLELGPANVEVRLKAPSAEWKVISDYHENTSPVVKVKRLILQRDSDISSYSEKDSEEEYENKKTFLQSSGELDSIESDLNDNDQVSSKHIADHGNWQPVVLLTRSKELDELTLSLDSKLSLPKESMLCSQYNNSSSENTSLVDSSDSHSDSELSEYCNEKVQFENENHYISSTLSSCSHSSETSSSSQHLKQELDIDSEIHKKSNYSYHVNKTSKSQVYETYSPSGCNNALCDENIYSPSDPHFSPDRHNRCSESSSSEGTRNECDDDVFLENNDMSLDQETCNSHSKYTIEESCNNQDDSCEKDQPRPKVLNCELGAANSELAKKFDESGQDSISELCSSNYSDVLGDLELTKLTNYPNRALQEICTTKEDEVNETSNEEISQSSEELTNIIVDKFKINNSSTKNIVELKPNVRRKMPKNFFVRKKCRKLNSEVQQCDLGASSIMPNNCLVQQTTFGTKKHHSTNSSSSSVDSYQCDSQSRKNTTPIDERLNSESDKSVSCEKSRLECTSDSEDPMPPRLNELPQIQRFDLNQKLRDGGRGIKRPCEGHSKEDTKRRRNTDEGHSNMCQDYDIQQQSKELSRSVENCELHHCSLCHRSFESAIRYHLHKRGRFHRHLELTQRHTVHTIHRLLVGTDCPQLPPLSRTEQQAMQWRPAQLGFAHVYHEDTPLQTALQEHSEVCGDPFLEERRND